MALTRRDVLRSATALTASTALRPLSSSAQIRKSDAPYRQPNILVFFTDDHGRWLQQAYGNSEVKTPNMERIARSGVLMTNAHTTTPVCSPARASFFTGRMPSQHGIHDWIEESKQAYAAPWLQGQKLISELLHSAGYHTGLVGKWHCGFERDPRPGFDFWYSYWVGQYPHAGKQQFSDNGREVTPEGFQSPLLTDQALRFLRDHYADTATRTKPFFLFVGYTDTHSPHTQMPEGLVAQYNDTSFRDIPRESFSSAHGKPLIPVSADPATERAKHQQCYAAASAIDREVGRILDELESSGHLEDTLVVYTGDHGLNAGHHGMWEKGNATIPQNFLEESILVPCAITWRSGGIPSGFSSDLRVNHCDLFMTLLAAANALPGESDLRKINSPGRSYLDRLRGQDIGSWSTDVICEYGNARMMKRDGYKLILRYPYDSVTFDNELYDLIRDPRETTNLYGKAEHQAVIQQMTAGIHEFFACYSVPEHDGLNLSQQPRATDASPWLEAVRLHKAGTT